MIAQAGKSVLYGKRVLLGVSGGIAAYKVIDLVRQLRKYGARVDVLMTESAEKFVTPLTFETLTRQPVRRGVFEQWTEAEAGHVTLAEQADIMVIAPATANTIAKLAHGLADDMLTVSALACPAPMLLAPAMDHYMYLNQATQDNLETLTNRGFHIIGPEEGELASGIVGHGRLAAPESIAGRIRVILGADGPLKGRRVVVSAGATREPLDPIRYISNRSSGRMGYAIAQALIDAGAHTTLVSAPSDQPVPIGVDLLSVESAGEMHQAVLEGTRDAHGLIMSAAVGDYAPREVSQEKVKKTEDDLSIKLARTVDILASINRPGLVKIGFAAETANLIEYATRKLTSKGVHLLVANDARKAMGASDNQAFFFRPDREPEELPLLSKDDLAIRIVEELTAIFGESGPSAES
ncbi:MAG: bifunctional phosphopantothenoylcysteine decarboxylase/phosphopantothenate--cysteine ligase CoaBC [Thermomicrobiaceae bacterium]